MVTVYAYVMGPIALLSCTLFVLTLVRDKEYRSNIWLNVREWAGFLWRQASWQAIRWQLAGQLQVPVARHTQEYVRLHRVV